MNDYKHSSGKFLDTQPEPVSADEYPHDEYEEVKESDAGKFYRGREIAIQAELPFDVKVAQEQLYRDRIAISCDRVLYPRRVVSCPAMVPWKRFSKRDHQTQTDVIQSGVKALPLELVRSDSPVLVPENFARKTSIGSSAYSDLTFYTAPLGPADSKETIDSSSSSGQDDASTYYTADEDMSTTLIPNRLGSSDAARSQQRLHLSASTLSTETKVEKRIPRATRSEMLPVKWGGKDDLQKVAVRQSFLRKLSSEASRSVSAGSQALAKIETKSSKKSLESVAHSIKTLSGDNKSVPKTISPESLNSAPSPVKEVKRGTESSLRSDTNETRILHSKQDVSSKKKSAIDTKKLQPRTYRDRLSLCDSREISFDDMLRFEGRRPSADSNKPDHDSIAHSMKSANQSQSNSTASINTAVSKQSGSENQVRSSNSSRKVTVSSADRQAATEILSSGNRASTVSHVTNTKTSAVTAIDPILTNKASVKTTSDATSTNKTTTKTTSDATSTNKTTTKTSSDATSTNKTSAKTSSDSTSTNKSSAKTTSDATLPSKPTTKTTSDATSTNKTTTKTTSNATSTNKTSSKTNSESATRTTSPSNETSSKVTSQDSNLKNVSTASSMQSQSQETTSTSKKDSSSGSRIDSNTIDRFAKARTSHHTGTPQMSLGNAMKKLCEKESKQIAVESSTAVRTMRSSLKQSDTMKCRGRAKHVRFCLEDEADVATGADLIPIKPAQYIMKDCKVGSNSSTSEPPVKETQEHRKSDFSYKDSGDSTMKTKSKEFVPTKAGLDLADRTSSHKLQHKLENLPSTSSDVVLKTKMEADKAIASKQLDFSDKIHTYQKISSCSPTETPMSEQANSAPIGEPHFATLPPASSFEIQKPTKTCKPLRSALPDGVKAVDGVQGVRVSEFTFHASPPRHHQLSSELSANRTAAKRGEIASENSTKKTFFERQSEPLLAEPITFASSLTKTGATVDAGMSMFLTLRACGSNRISFRLFLQSVFTQ